MKKDIKKQLAYGLTIYSAITIFQYAKTEELVREFLISEGFIKNNELDIVALRKKYPFNPILIEESLKEDEFNIVLCENNIKTGKEAQQEGDVKIKKYEENILSTITGYIFRNEEEQMNTKPKNAKVIYESNQNSWICYKYCLSADETYYYAHHYTTEDRFFVKRMKKETIHSLIYTRTQQLLEEKIQAA